MIYNFKLIIFVRCNDYSDPNFITAICSKIIHRINFSVYDLSQWVLKKFWGNKSFIDTVPKYNTLWVKCLKTRVLCFYLILNGYLVIFGSSDDSREKLTIINTKIFEKIRLLKAILSEMKNRQFKHKTSILPQNSPLFLRLFFSFEIIH